MKFEDLTGDVFGRLTVAKRAQNIGKRTAWLCKCSCGNETTVTSCHLKSGHTISCGCFNKERNSITHKKYSVSSRSKIYGVWNSMKNRCYNPNAINYSDYGARGVIVCSLWKEDFGAFYEYVSKLPHYGEDGYSINRINNDGNYEPNNVEWSNLEEQANNKRNSRYITFNNQTHTLAEWARLQGISYMALAHRLYRGWDVKEALTTPVAKTK